MKPRRRPRLLFTVVALAAPLVCFTTAAAAPSSLAERARSIREIEDLGAYSRVVGLMRAFREVAPIDADLELALALNEARIGQVDSCTARLWGPLLSEAMLDTLPIERRQAYFWGRDVQWTNGTWDGWPWYIARARAEVAAVRGDWSEAALAARIAVEARPMSGKDWLIWAVCAAHAGYLGDSQVAALQAARLDPTLPEPLYLLGLHAWRDRRTSEAQRAFREAIRRDSTWQAPALALVRSLVAAANPDPFPSALLTGLREVSLLTAPAWPKLEYFLQMETPASLVHRPEVQFPPDLKPGTASEPLFIYVFLDERGRAVAHELPWFPPGTFSDGFIGAVVGSLPLWEFTPAAKLGKNQRVWVTVEFRAPEQ